MVSLRQFRFLTELHKMYRCVNLILEIKLCLLNCIVNKVDSDDRYSRGKLICVCNTYPFVLLYVQVF